MSAPSAPSVPTLPDEIRRGRTSRWRYVTLPQWALLMPGLSDAALRVYALLLAQHVPAGVPAGASLLVGGAR